MKRLLLFCIATLCAGAAIAHAQESHPTLSIGSHAPNFELPGVDGKVHKLSDYASARILAVVFTCNHCPIAQLYEDRIKQLAADYQSQGVALIAIQPNDPSAIRIDELDSADMSDRLEKMKIRAVSVELADANELAKLRANRTGKYLYSRSFGPPGAKPAFTA